MINTTICCLHVLQLLVNDDCVIVQQHYQLISAFNILHTTPQTHRRRGSRLAGQQQPLCLRQLQREQQVSVCVLWVSCVNAFCFVDATVRTRHFNPTCITLCDALFNSYFHVPRCRLVPESTVLKDGDLVILSGERMVI